MIVYASASDYARLCKFSGPSYTNRVLIWLDRENPALGAELRKLMEKK